MKADQFSLKDLIYMHIDMGNLVQYSYLSPSLWCLTNIKRYIIMGIHSPGIAGLYTRLKVHSSRSVALKELLHTGTGRRVSHDFFLMFVEDNNIVQTHPMFMDHPFSKTLTQRVVSEDLVTQTKILKFKTEALA